MTGENERQNHRQMILKFVKLFLDTNLLKLIT